MTTIEAGLLVTAIIVIAIPCIWLRKKETKEKPHYDNQDNDKLSIISAIESSETETELSSCFIMIAEFKKKYSGDRRGDYNVSRLESRYTDQETRIIIAEAMSHKSNVNLYPYDPSI